MTHHALLENLARFDPTETERIFGEALSINPAGRSLAPVKRIALIAEAFLPKVDGVSKSAYLTMRYLQQTGREVLVFAPDIAPRSLDGAQVIPMPSLGLPSAPETRIPLPHPMVLQHLNTFKPDLIHMFSPALLSASGMIAAHQNRVPVIANYQTDLPAYSKYYGYPFLTNLVRDWLRFVHNGCHLTLVPSNWTLKQLQRDGYHRLRRWGRGVNSVLFNPARRSDAWRARLLNGRDPASLLCIYVGRLANEKQVDLLIEVAKTPGIALTIIGDGALREELERRFSGTGTHFTGYLYGEDLANAYASADVFMFTGAAETFGQVVQEAMASALPCVIINQGGITDLVQDGVNGFVVPGEPAAFAAAARQLRDNPHLRKQMSLASRRIAEQNPWDKVLGELEGFYNEALQLNERFQRMRRPIPSRFPFIWPRSHPPARTIYDRVS